jgi:hypothetical protein
MPLRIGHEDIVQPGLDPETDIWRYMDVSKFLDLLETRTLYFSRADRFEDKHEGSLTEDEKARQKKIDDYYRSKDLAREEDEYKERFREKIFVNCWHGSDFENMAMWKIYGGSDNSVAIISTVERLTDALLEKCACVPELVIAKVKYIDYNKHEFDPIPVPSKSLTWAHVAPFFHKWKAYTFEDEIRAIFNTEVHFPHYTGIHDHPTEYGFKIPTEPEKLIKKIVLSPEAPQWFRKLISDIVTMRYGIKPEICSSSLNGEPISL